MILWRIATETRRYKATDMSGGGAASNPGRWNEENQPVVYAAPSIAIAVLETAAHINDGGLPLNRFVVRIDVPDAVWDAREELDVRSLAPTWAAIPAGATSIQLGSAWLQSQRSAIFLVPSVIVPEERAALINPAHADAKQLRASVHRAFDYNRLFRGS